MKHHTDQQRADVETAAESLYRAFLALRTPAEVRQFLQDL